MQLFAISKKKEKTKDICLCNIAKKKSHIILLEDDVL